MQQLQSRIKLTIKLTIFSFTGTKKPAYPPMDKNNINHKKKNHTVKSNPRWTKPITGIILKLSTEISILSNEYRSLIGFNYLKDFKKPSLITRRSCPPTQHFHKKYRPKGMFMGLISPVEWLPIISISLHALSRNSELPRLVNNTRNSGYNIRDGKNSRER